MTNRDENLGTERRKSNERRQIVEETQAHCHESMTPTTTGLVDGVVSRSSPRASVSKEHDIVANIWRLRARQMHRLLASHFFIRNTD